MISLFLAPAWLRRVGPAVLFQFCFVATTALWKSAANAVVLSRGDAKSLPYLYIAGAVATALLSATVATSRWKISAVHLAWVGAAVVVMLGLGLQLRVRWVPLVLYVFAETFATYLSITFWSTVGQKFDAQEAKRAFTQISGLGMLGSVLGGGAARQMALHGGVQALLFSGIVLLLVGAWVFRPHAFVEERSIHRIASPKGELWAYVKTHRYAQVLGLFVMSLALLSALADYLFRTRASAAMNEEALAALFGGFQLWMGLLCTAWQVFLAQWLLQRVGVIRYIAAIPLLMVPWALACVLVPSLWPAYGLKLLESAVSLSVLPVGMQLLYGPAPDGLRDRLRSMIDGLAKKTGLALGGVLLIVVAQSLSAQSLAVLVWLVCVTASIAVLWVRPLYVDTLRERVLNVSSSSQSVAWPLAPLEKALSSRRTEEILRALAMMEHSDVDVGPYLSRLLTHSDGQVMERALVLSMKAPNSALASAIEPSLDDGNVSVRKAAIRALALHAPAQAEPHLRKFLAAPEAEIQATAVGAILAYVRNADLRQEAQNVLQASIELESQASFEKRIEAARLLGRAHDGRWAKFLERYLADDDVRVRSAAIEAIGEGRYVALSECLFTKLALRDERRAAREALSRLGDTVVPRLEALMNDRQLESAVRYQIPRVLRQVGTQKALEALLFSNIQDDAFLHYRIGVALSRLFEAHPELKVDANWVLSAVGRRKETYSKWVGPYRDLRAALGDDSLLTRAVGDRLDQALELSFWLLGLLHDAAALRRAHAHLTGPDAQRRAWALEYLEHILPQGERLLIVEQLEAHHRALPLGESSKLLQVLQFLCFSDDHVLRACARHLARELGQHILHQEGDMNEDLVRRMFAFEGVEIFAHSDVDDIAAVASIAKEQRLPKGTSIYKEGDPGDALYVIIEGAVEAFRGGKFVLKLHAKQAFGDVSLLDGSPRPTEMIATEDCTLLMIDRRDFLDLVSDRPELLKGIYRAVAQQLRDMLDLPGRQLARST